MWCDERTNTGRTLFLVLLVSVLLVPIPSVADHGPLPTGGPTDQSAQIVQDNAQDSVLVAQGSADHSQEQSLQAVQAVRDGLDEGQVRIPLGHADSILERGFEDAEAVWSNSVGSVSAAHAGAGGQAEEAEAFRDLIVQAGLNRLGIDPEAPLGSLLEPETECIEDLQGAVDTAEPGEEIRVCAGTYQGPIHVRQHFLNVVAEQGPAATIIDGGGSHGFVINATGVTIRGFRIQGADGNDTAGVRIGGNETHSGVAGPTGTVLLGNEFRRNTLGVVIQQAPGTVLVGNTFWASAPGPDQEGGVGVLVTMGASGLDLLQEGPGVLVAANNFQNNARHAIKNVAVNPGESSLPTFAVFNHYNSVLGPNIQVGEACHGPSAPEGDPQCRDGISQGVVPVGHNPEPW